MLLLALSTRIPSSRRGHLADLDCANVRPEMLERANIGASRSFTRHDYVDVLWHSAGIIWALRRYDCGMPRPRTKERLSAESRLALVRAKVERAKENLRDMEKTLRTFHHHTPGDQIEIKSRGVRPGQIYTYHVPFNTLAAAGDVVNNLRGGLNHLVCQLMLANRPRSTQKQLAACQFPIGKSEAAYKQARGTRLKGVSPGAVQLIDALKPYKGGNDALWLLSELDNISKHRLLLSMGKVVMCYADWVGEMSLSNAFMYKLGRPQFSGIYGRPKMHDYDLVPGKETIRKVRATRREALLPTLHYLVDAVDSLTYQFLPFLK
jgi:hypothetical protein